MIIVRAAHDADTPILGRMGAALARLHHAWDPARFMLPADIEGGLKTSTRNASAQRLFASLGWRPTMLEMTREAGATT